MMHWRLIREGWTLAVILLAVASVWFLVVPAEGQPVPPTQLNVTSTSRRSNPPSATVEALAGNVTEITINAMIVTKAWAGYYGNVSGTIVLDDALNNTLFSWALDEPSGEVYAAKQAIDFGTSNIICPNESNIQDEETNLSIGTTDKDGVNETFTLTTHPQFYVGTKLIQEDECNYTVSTYVDNSADADRGFNETLLYDIANDQIVYTAIIASNQDGFKVGDEVYDFQMLVGEDGQDNTETTPYYFYVEIE